VTAIPLALKRSGLALDDVHHFEIYEAFATMAMACTGSVLAVERI
jgi:acetyl-CoA acetyltransferase